MPSQISPTQIEDALSKSCLYVLMSHGKYWRCRRNGATKLWKRQPTHFRIPIKCGYRTCGYVTHTSTIHPISTYNDWITTQSTRPRPDFIISLSDPNTTKTHD